MPAMMKSQRFSTLSWLTSFQTFVLAFTML